MGAWVILLEWEIGDGVPLPSDAAPIRDLLEDFAGYNHAALFAADRYSLRLEVDGDPPDALLGWAMACHHEAADRAHLRGWRMVRAEITTPEQLEREWLDSGLLAGLLSALPTDSNDPVVKAEHLLDDARCAHEVSEILCKMVRELGGGVVRARLQDGWTLPVDLSFGAGDPVVPVAEPWSRARDQLEQALPRMVERARRIAAERPECDHNGTSAARG